MYLLCSIQICVLVFAGRLAGWPNTLHQTSWSPLASILYFLSELNAPLSVSLVPYEVAYLLEDSEHKLITLPLGATIIICRKRSETRRPAGLPEWNAQPELGHEANMPLALPPASDFRTSLILPRFVRVSRSPEVYSELTRRPGYIVSLAGSQFFVTRLANHSLHHKFAKGLQSNAPVARQTILLKRRRI